ncbi:MAG: hypothetical protein G5Z42_02525 [Caldisphaeraceae archaeon]|nr:hypothetical protein [Caldisphaeraceae archaeon]
MESREEFYRWKKRLDERLDEAIAKLEAMEQELAAEEQEIDRKLNELRQKLRANSALRAKAEKEQN